MTLVGGIGGVVYYGVEPGTLGMLTSATGGADEYIGCPVCDDVGMG